eukprot:6070761-Karenia_brevis.AAC.1
MIVDARQANRSHRKPPKVQLGSVRAMAELDLSEGSLQSLGGFGAVSEIHPTAGDTDVDDSFYNFSCRQTAS